MNTLSLKESNDKIIELLQSNKPFYISRMGIGAETYIPYIYKTTNNFQHNDIKKLLYMLDNNNGIYNLNLDSLKKYCNLYYNSIKNSDYLASFINYIINEQKFMKPDNKELLYSRILEPFYCCLEDIKPWSHYLLGKGF